MRTHKTKKSKKMHGRNMGTHGGGARKKRKGSGHRGGIGMSGSGKRADHKKTLITKLFGNDYFGRKGVTSRGSKRDKQKRINIEEIETKLDTFIRKGIAKKKNSGFEIDLSGSKVLGKGEVKEKLIIKAKEASKSAIEKVKKSGGEIILTKKDISNVKEVSKNES